MEVLTVGGWLTGEGIVQARREGDITIEPFAEACVNPNSYNYTLGSEIKRLASLELDMLTAEAYESLQIPEEGIVLLPGECYLGSTAEVFGSSIYASLVTGRSSVGRKFITNHITAGLVDIGFFGRITLEITVQRRIRVYAGVPFGQIFWFTAAGGLSRQYAGKYADQRGATESRLHWKVGCDRGMKAV